MEKKILMGFIAMIATVIVLLAVAIIFYQYIKKIPAIIWLALVILCTALLNYMKNKYGKKY
jgi:fatty acid desaturase